MRRMTSRGVKCSPAVSLEASANFRMSSSKASPMSWLLTRAGAGRRRRTFRDLVEQVRLAQPLKLLGEAEVLEDVPHRRGEALDIGGEVGGDVVLVAHQLAHVERRGVHEGVAGDAQQERLGVHPGGFPLGLLREHGRLGGSQHAVQAAQHGERQDDLAVLRGLEVAPEEVGDGPDEGGDGGWLAHGILSRTGRWVSSMGARAPSRQGVRSSAAPQRRRVPLNTPVVAIETSPESVWPFAAVGVRPKPSESLGASTGLLEACAASPALWRLTATTSDPPARPSGARVPSRSSRRIRRSCP